MPGRAFIRIRSLRFRGKDLFILTVVGIRPVKMVGGDPAILFPADGDLAARSFQLGNGKLQLFKFEFGIVLGIVGPELFLRRLYPLRIDKVRNNFKIIRPRFLFERKLGSHRAAALDQLDLFRTILPVPIITEAVDPVAVGFFKLLPLQTDLAVGFLFDLFDLGRGCWNDDRQRGRDGRPPLLL